ncbi:MAG: SDR family NAD(P)-dependent oxidoreductase [Ruminococcaceae bacterium]|nr:SDR family NAD(P)-dependent oxidoreductase [Oscillospiraceae bacterium]
MKKIAVITGASSGFGKRFAETVSQFGEALDEVWVIARRKERLETLELGVPKRVLALDLADEAALKEYAALLEKEKPDVRLLLNVSGYGKFCATMDATLEENIGMVKLNCIALMSMCQYTVPFMGKGAKIMNIASVASHQPVPYINVYAATKAFVLSYSRALNCELEDISVMAVCPFWTRTEFFDRAVERDKDAVVKTYVAMYDTEDVVARAWRDLRLGKDVSKYGFIARAQMLLAKIFPHRFVMWFWMKQQKLG